MKFIYQQGGSIPAFGVYQSRPRQTATQKPEKTSSKSSDKDLGMKDVIELVGKMKGLPGDIAAVQDKVKMLVKNIERKLQSPEGIYGHTSSIASEYMELVSLASMLTQQDSYYQEAKKNAIAKGSMNEVVIDSTGRIKVFDKYAKKYTWTTIEDYEENSDMYRPVTNAELLDSRYNGLGGLAFDTETVTAVSDGVSLKSIQDKITSELEKLESNQFSTTGYVSKQQRDILKGVQSFKEAVKQTASGTLGEVFSEKITSKDQAQQIKHAFNYIYTNLTTKEKALLQFNSRNMEGGVMGLLSHLIASRQGLSYEYTPIDIDPTKKGSGSGKEDDNILEEFKLSPADLLQASYARNQNIIIQTPEGMKNAIRLTAVKLPLTGSDNNPVGASVTLDKLFESPHMGSIDEDNISMGGAFIRPEAAVNVAINGGNVYMGYLPVTYTDDGKIKPNLSLLADYQAAMNEIKKQGIDMKKDPDKVNAIFRDKKLPVFYGKDGVNVTKYHKFLMLNGVATNRAFSQNVQLEEWLTEIKDMNEKQNNLITIGKAYGKDIDFDHASDWDEVMPFFNSHDSMYRGTIFIPTNYNVFNSAVSSGTSITAQEAEDLSARQQAQDRGNVVTMVEDNL